MICVNNGRESQSLKVDLIGPFASMNRQVSYQLMSPPLDLVPKSNCTNMTTSGRCHFFYSGHDVTFPDVDDLAASLDGFDLKGR